MPRLTLRRRPRWMDRPSRRARGDRGAVAALVAILLSGNVLLGMGALTVDVGLLYAEREQLQSGADAAAIAIAKECAGNSPACTQTAMENLATDWAGRNAKDGTSRARVCGRVLTGGPGATNRLDECEPTGGTLSRCLDVPNPVPASPAPYIQVNTSTRLSNGDLALPPAFSSAVAGTSGANVGACSRVTWGPVRSATVEPAMAISICTFNNATAGGTSYAPMPRGGSHRADPSDEIRLVWREPDAAGGGCGGTGNGFGWFAGTSSCRLSGVDVGDWIDGRTSRTMPAGCLNDLARSRTNRTVFPVAIFDGADEPGHNNEFRVAGIAAFVVTGYYRPPDPPFVPAINEPPLLGGVSPCNGSRVCVYGYFTTQVFRTGDGALGAPHFGAVHVRTIG